MFEKCISTPFTVVKKSQLNQYILDLNFFSDPDQYPDLLNIHPKHPSSPKVGQPLNPAALVMPPTPPAQFPHQFQVHKIFFPPFTFSHNGVKTIMNVNFVYAGV